MIFFRISLTASLIFMGAIFGFFYAYIASGINGLSTMTGHDAINAMNAINGAIRNATFFPFFFLTPVICLIAAIVGFFVNARQSAFALGTATLIYIFGGIMLTMIMNVPMNETLMALDTNNLSPNQASIIWQDYARDWSFWNTTRTILSGLAFLCVGYAIYVAPKALH